MTTKSDITSNQVEAGVWTYLEISIGITCGNLPLLLPLVRSWFSTGDTTRGYHSGPSENQRSGGGYTPRAPTQRSTPKKPSPYDGFTNLDDSPVGSEVELRDRVDRVKVVQSVSGDSVGTSSYRLGPEVSNKDIALAADRPDGGIVVQTRVDVQYDDREWGRASGEQRNVVVGGHGVDASPRFRSHSRGDVPEPL